MLKDLLKHESLIPAVSLPEAFGDHLNISDYKQRKNLVLVFFHSSKCEFCRRVARSFKFFASRYKEENAEVLLILPEKLAEAREFKEELHLPCKVLADEEEKGLAKFVEVSGEEDEPLVAVFVVDRFGALVDQWLFSREETFPEQERFLTSLHGVEIECPECGVGEWPA